MSRYQTWGGICGIKFEDELAMIPKKSVPKMLANKKNALLGFWLLPNKFQEAWAMAEMRMRMMAIEDIGYRSQVYRSQVYRYQVYRYQVYRSQVYRSQVYRYQVYRSQVKMIQP